MLNSMNYFYTIMFLLWFPSIPALIALLGYYAFLHINCESKYDWCDSIFTLNISWKSVNVVDQKSQIAGMLLNDYENYVNTLKSLYWAWWSDKYS